VRWVEDGTCPQKIAIISYNPHTKVLGNPHASFSIVFKDH